MLLYHDRLSTFMSLPGTIGKLESTSPVAHTAGANIYRIPNSQFQLFALEYQANKCLELTFCQHLQQMQQILQLISAIPIINRFYQFYGSVTSQYSLPQCHRTWSLIVLDACHPKNMLWKKWNSIIWCNRAFPPSHVATVPDKYLLRTYRILYVR